MNREQIALSYRQSILEKAKLPELTEELKAVAVRKAKGSHEGWLEAKEKKGYVYGPVTNDDPKKGALTNPNMKSWEMLDEEVIRDNVANAEAVIKLMLDEGFKFVSFTEIIKKLAEGLHDEWCREKIENGWKWGSVTDKEKKIHRDLLPFTELLSDPNLAGDCDFDVDTAKSFLIGMIVDTDLFPIISA